MELFWDAAKQYIEVHCPEDLPEIAIVLGSGLADVIKEAEILWESPYKAIPGFPESTAPGHKSRLLWARWSGRKVFFLQGRLHYYEGHSVEDTVFPIHLLASLGVKTLILTNAAGGLNPDLELPALMLIKDHLSFFLPSPLRGPNNEDLGPRFPDMTYVYSPELRALAIRAAAEEGIRLDEGVYAYMRGPQYETPAEIRALQRLGADAVGMSTVAEAITASYRGMDVLAISSLTNLGAGLGQGGLDHEDVLQMGRKAGRDLRLLLGRILTEL